MNKSHIKFRQQALFWIFNDYDESINFDAVQRHVRWTANDSCIEKY